MFILNSFFNKIDQADRQCPVLPSYIPCNILVMMFDQTKPIKPHPSIAHPPHTHCQSEFELINHSTIRKLVQFLFIFFVLQPGPGPEKWMFSRLLITKQCYSSVHVANWRLYPFAIGSSSEALSIGKPKL